VVGDNIRPERSFVTLSYDGQWAQLDDPTIWEHFVVDGPHPEPLRRRVMRSLATGSDPKSPHRVEPVLAAFFRANVVRT
jgi:hypothetical protein